MYALRTFGSPRIVDADGQSHDAILSQPRRFALLVYLAALPREYESRRLLASLFWPNSSDAHARGALKQAVFAIRRTLGADVIISRGSQALGLNRDVLKCDVIQFKDAFREGRFNDVVALYGGGFLETFHVDAGRELQSWIDKERTTLANDYRVALAAREDSRLTPSVANPFVVPSRWSPSLRSVALMAASVVAVAVAAATRQR